MDFPAFKGVVIDGGSLASCGEGAPIRGVKDDQIRVAAGLDGSFFWEEIKNFCGVGAGDIDKGMEVEAAGADAGAHAAVSPAACDPAGTVPARARFEVKFWLPQAGQ